MPALPGFVGPTYQSRGVTGSVDECINWYPEILGTSGAKKVSMLVPTPGLRLFSTLPGSGGIRGLHVASSGRLFAVRGPGFFEIDVNGNPTLHGTIANLTTPVVMADNGAELCVVDGMQGWVFTFGTNTMSLITDADFPGATHVGFLDGYFIFVGAEGQRFRISALYAGGTFDGLDFGVAEGNPDPASALVVDHREAWIFGAQSAEVTYNSGNPDFPIDRIQGAFVEQGATSYSPAKLANGVYWLGVNHEGRGVVWRAVGYQPQRISTHAIEYQLGRMGTISDARGFAFQHEGHHCYCLTFPTGNATYVFDATTELWHRRASMDGNGVQQRWRGQWHAMAFGKSLVGDYADGRIYQLDPTYALDDTALIARDRMVGPTTDPDNLTTIFYDEFRLDADVGIGLNSGQGSDPQVMLRVSQDGGRTWGNERVRSLGPQGTYRTTVRWQKCGGSPQHAWWIRVTDPVPCVLYGAHVRAQAGRY